MFFEIIKNRFQLINDLSLLVEIQNTKVKENFEIGER